MMRIKWQQYLRPRYLVLTGAVSAILLLLASSTILIRLGHTTFQIADGLYLTLIASMPGPMMLVVGLVYPLMFDLFTANFILIPFSMGIHVLMFVVIKGLRPWLPLYLLFAISALLVLIYVPVNYFLNLGFGQDMARGLVIRELIVDSIQAGLSWLLAIILKLIFAKTKLDVYLRTKALQII